MESDGVGRLFADTLPLAFRDSVPGIFLMSNVGLHPLLISFSLDLRLWEHSTFEVSLGLSLRGDRGVDLIMTFSVLPV